MMYVRVLNGEITERGLPEPSPRDQSNLAEGKPRILPYEERRATPKPGEVLEGPVEDVQAKKVVATWKARTLTAEEIASTIDGLVWQIKDEAQRRILEIMPAHRQTNWLARKAELDLLHGPDPSGWPEADRAAVAAVLGDWDRIKAVREKSNTIEADLCALTKAADIVAFDPTAGWE